MNKLGPPKPNPCTCTTYCRSKPPGWPPPNGEYCRERSGFLTTEDVLPADLKFEPMPPAADAEDNLFAQAVLAVSSSSPAGEYVLTVYFDTLEQLQAAHSYVVRCGQTKS